MRAPDTALRSFVVAVLLVLTLGGTLSSEVAAKDKPGSPPVVAAKICRQGQWQILARSDSPFTPFTSQKECVRWLSAGNTATAVQHDGDGDGTADGVDNCSSVANTDQADFDGDASGDACDLDDDNDGVDDTQDPWPYDPFLAYDADADQVPDESDNCVFTSNPDQTDSDYDLIGDACDDTPYPIFYDTDYDGVDDNVDNCFETSNPEQTDTDGDFIGDACDSTPYGDNDNDGIDNLADNCVDAPNPDQSDMDGDGLGDPCDPTSHGDADADGVNDLIDNCVGVFNPDQGDADGDGLGDGCDG
jgi:hypothetical protein